MLSIIQITETLGVDKSTIYNRLRKKKYQDHIKVAGKNKYLSDEGFKLLKEEIDNIDNIEEIAVTIVNDPEEFNSFEIENEEVIYLKERVKFLENLLQQEQEIKKMLLLNHHKEKENLYDLQIKQNEVHTREISRVDSLLLEKKQELLARQEKRQEEKKKKRWLFWK